ncbi:Sua5 family C-terminal domain-containing protein [Streptomyces sp. NPDC058335]|uniref:Sua5 family C-terminal domain-containing protein n=1 Tax=Streptomyces sp. NPDC058335 TaxID=3346451 RepID=UPI003662B541
MPKQPPHDHLRLDEGHRGTPRARVVLVEAEKVVAEAEFAQELGAPGRRPSSARSRRRPGQGARRGGGPASTAAYARGLYGLLRELDEQGCDLIVASLPVEERAGTGDRQPAPPRRRPRPTV